MIEDPPLLTIRRDFARPSAAQLAALENVPTGFLVDAMDGSGALDYRIKPIVASRAVFLGTAVTCATGPSDNLAIFGAVAQAVAGDVIVVASDGFTGTASIGDNLAGMARNRGAVAMVTDGLVRDLAGLERIGLPIAARGVTPNSCVRSGPGTVGLPVVVGGVAVESGDVVVGDRDGIVVVPRARLAAVLARLATVRQAEAAFEAKVTAGLAVPDWIETLLASDRVRWI
jgi:4-hydroxy-4-methyl-2-oxoglutarate aldolase